MNQDIENYIEEFATYLRNKNKSNKTIRLYTQVVKEIYEASGKTPKTLTWKDVENFVTYVRTTYKFHGKRFRYAGLKKYIMFLKLEHKNKTYDDYQIQINTTGDDIFKNLDTPRNTYNKETLTINETVALINKPKTTKKLRYI